jgi:hypothetical protein
MLGHRLRVLGRRHRELLILEVGLDEIGEGRIERHVG